MKEYRFSKYIEREYILPNGLKIHYFPYPEYHTTYMGFVIPYGSNMCEYKINGRKVKSGIAHFLEHRMFDSKNGDMIRMFSSLGAICNAYTYYDRTCYYFQTIHDPFEAFKVLCDLVFNFHSTRDKVINERSIIVEEMLGGLEDPRDELNKMMQHKLIVKDGLKYPIIGTKKDIISTTLKDLKEAYNAFYDIKDMYLIVVGPYPIEPIIDYISTNYKENKNHNYVIEKIDYKDEFKKCNHKKVVIERIAQNDTQSLKFKIDIKPLIDKYGRNYFDTIIEYALSLLFDVGSDFNESFNNLDVIYNSLSYSYYDCEEIGILSVFYIAKKSIRQNKLIFDGLNNPKKYISSRNLELYARKMYGKKLVFLQETDSLFQNATIDIKDDSFILESIAKENKVLLDDIEYVLKYFGTCDYIKGVMKAKE